MIDSVLALQRENGSFDTHFDYGNMDGVWVLEYLGSRSDYRRQDVLAAAVRPGSLDARIDVASAQCNDFHALLADCPSLRCIGFNGKTAARLFRQDAHAMQAAADHDIELADLPSTSPAHAAMHYDDKCRRWSEVIACYIKAS